MIKSKLDVVQVGADRFRVGPWRGDSRIAYVAPAAGRPVAIETVEQCLRGLAQRGYGSVLTSALTTNEQDPFVACGFEVHERLHLLRHDLHHLDDPPPVRLRRALRFDHAAVLALDGLAFDPFWRFDHQGLVDARRATPSSRFRIADADGLAGYAITGRAGPVGYLQRLAVHPDRQRRGIGAALVTDSLTWVRSRGATTLLVNTQEHNARALRLYERLGFVREVDGLAVLERPLERPLDPRGPGQRP
jgi:ribosomal protein S18 acetylase RimI-like enzyme